METSVISYLAARQSPSLIIAACQQITSEWWFEGRYEYELFTSELVVIESRGGDPDVVERRLELLEGIPELKVTDNVTELAAALISEGTLPEKAQADAIHISVATVHNIDYLLTWNCRHINNPATKPAVRSVCNSMGFRCPEICTPIEIMEVKENEE